MITDCWKLTAKVTLYGMSFLFLTLELIQSLSSGLYAPYKKPTPNISRRP